MSILRDIEQLNTALRDVYRESAKRGTGFCYDKPDFEGFQPVAQTTKSKGKVYCHKIRR